MKQITDAESLSQFCEACELEARKLSGHTAVHKCRAPRKAAMKPERMKELKENSEKAKMRGHGWPYTVVECLDEIERLQARLPICPPCEIGENTPCICDSQLVPKEWLDAATNELASVKAKAEGLREALEAMIGYARDAEASGDAGHWDVEKETEIIQARAALAAYDEKEGEL